MLQRPVRLYDNMVGVETGLVAADRLRKRAAVKLRVYVLMIYNDLAAG